MKVYCLHHSATQKVNRKANIRKAANWKSLFFSQDKLALRWLGPFLSLPSHLSIFYEAHPRMSSCTLYSLACSWQGMPTEPPLLTSSIIWPEAFLTMRTTWWLPGHFFLMYFRYLPLSSLLHHIEWMIVVG